MHQYQQAIIKNQQQNIYQDLFELLQWRMLTQVFSGVAIIFGLYLLFRFFTSHDLPIIRADTTYHIGCYDPDYHNNHSVELVQKLSIIQSKIRQSTKLNMYHSKALTPNFDKDVRDVARSFESYLDHYYRVKGANDQDINYYNSLQLARMEFDRCARDVHFSEEQCLRAWQLYKGTSDEVDKLKRGLTELIDAKEKNQIALSAIILKRPTIGQDQIQKNYLIKTKQIKSKIIAGDQNIVQLRASKTKIRSEMTSLDANLNQLKSILNDCINNQQLIRYCNQLSKQVHKLQQSAPKLTKKELQSRLQLKLQIISGIQANIKKAIRANELGDVVVEKQQLQRQRNQFKLLQFQIQNFQSKTQQRCAMCSEQRIRQLRKNISDLEARKKQLDKSYIQVQVDISRVDAELSGWNKQIEDAQKQRQVSMSSIFCLDDQCKRDQRNSIQDKQVKLNQLKKQIIDKQVQINYLNSGHGTKLNNVKLYLEPISKIIDCLRKREYYEQLKKRAPAEKKIDSKMIEIKKSVIKQLNDFEL